ncbi:uncharacterized protein [Triticum aestivum]|uniref:uncharacterized protein isoform X2 n=1 Tax=Triticum aestivum TaxID=4565 RepID=UPI001D01A9EC|nr:uncharacterized protein LOC123180925 isoform X2 [Triticum aestivum]
MCPWTPSRFGVQICDLSVPIKTEEMGRILGDKLGMVLAVSHRNKQIVDEHLRVHVIHQVDEPLKKTATSSIIVGHTTAKFCSIPKVLRKANYSTGIKAPPFWKKIQRHLDFEGLLGSPDHEDSWKKAKLLDNVITVVTTAVKNLSVAAAPLLASSDGA